MKYFYLVICLIALFPMDGGSQDTEWESNNFEEAENETPRFSFLSFDFDWNIPVGMKRDFLKRHNLGIGVRYLHQVKQELPLFAGVSLFYGTYDQSSYEYYDFSEIDEFLFRETAECAIFNVNLDIRYFPGLGFWVFEPFVGSSIGLSNSMLYTTTYNVDLGENNGFAVEENSWQPVYLFEAGTLIRFDEALDEIFGHFTLGYASGTNNTFFLKKPDYNASEKPVTHFEKKKIPFQMLKMNFGIIAYF